MGFESILSKGFLASLLDNIMLIDIRLKVIYHNPYSSLFQGPLNEDKQYTHPNPSDGSTYFHDTCYMG